MTCVPVTTHDLRADESMPFRYFGGKKALARHYPSPQFPTIIEPFAGSAGYSLWHATTDHRVILVERDERIVGLWHRLQAMSLEDLMRIGVPARGSRCLEPLINLTTASENILRSRCFHDSQVTGRMVEKWPGSRAYIAGKLELIRSWTVIHGDYSDAPDIAATWHIDPPYAPRDGQPRGSRGEGYAPHCNSRMIDYGHLAGWSQSRQGQVMVCEQEGAQWLPFRPFRRTRTTSSAGATMTAVEAIWTDPT